MALNRLRDSLLHRASAARVIPRVEIIGSERSGLS